MKMQNVLVELTNILNHMDNVGMTNTSSYNKLQSLKIDIESERLKEREELLKLCELISDDKIYDSHYEDIEKISKEFT